jgi:hypothetical protein
MDRVSGRGCGGHNNFTYGLICQSYDQIHWLYTGRTKSVSIYYCDLIGISNGKLYRNNVVINDRSGLYYNDLLFHKLTNCRYTKSLKPMPLFLCALRHWRLFTILGAWRYTFVCGFAGKVESSSDIIIDLEKHQATFIIQYDDPSFHVFPLQPQDVVVTTSGEVALGEALNAVSLARHVLWREWALTWVPQYNMVSTEYLPAFQALS